MGGRLWVRLGAYHSPHAPPAAQPLSDSIWPDARVRLVEGRDVDLHVIAQNTALLAIQGQAIHHRQGVGWNGGTKPLDDVTIVVIVRWLNQHQGKMFGCLGSRHEMDCIGKRYNSKDIPNGAC